MKKLLKNRFFYGIILAILTILSIIYYSVSFISESGLNFSTEDGFILTMQAIGFLIVSILLIWIIIDRQRLYDLLKKIFEQIEEDNDNNMILHKETQSLLIKLFKKNKEDDDAKKQ